MYSIQQQCNTTIYLHPGSSDKITSVSKLNKSKSKRRLSQPISGLLIVQWLIILFLGYGNCCVNEISGSFLGYTGALSMSPRVQQALPNSRRVFMSQNVMEFFEDIEELEENQRKRINTAFLTIISIYRIVPYIVKPKKYFQNLNWKCLSPHLPYYVRYCSLKIPSNSMFNQSRFHTTPTVNLE